MRNHLSCTERKAAVRGFTSTETVRIRDGDEGGDSNTRIPNTAKLHCHDQNDPALNYDAWKLCSARPSVFQ